MSNIRGIPGEIPVDGNIYKGIETESTTTHVNNFTKEISVNVKEDYFNEKLETKQDKLIAGESIEINENNEISVKSEVLEEVDNTIEITSEDITIEDDKIVFNSDVAHEIMSMNKRIKADAHIIDPTVEQGTYVGIFTPRGVIDYSTLQEGTTVYEYSTTNWLLDCYRTTYVEFIWDATTEKLYLNTNTPAHYENHIRGFWTGAMGNISLTSDTEISASSISTLRINDLDTISFDNNPSLEFNANENNELESIAFKQNGYSSDFTYTIPKGAKHYVVNELPTTDIDATGNYYVMTESENARGYLSTDIRNLTTTEFPVRMGGESRSDAVVNTTSYTALPNTLTSVGEYRGSIAIKFNIPCTVTVTLNPRPTGSGSGRFGFMNLYKNNYNNHLMLTNAGEVGKVSQNFAKDEILCIDCSGFTNQFYYKLAIQPYTIDGKIPLSTNVDEYINFENMWFKNGDGTKVVANPTLVGDEPDLEGAEIDGIKYKVGGGGTITLDNIVDNNGNKRFINGYGIWGAVSGMQGLYGRWALNGYNLTFEAMGTFSESLSADTNLCKFKIPSWIMSKIQTPYMNIVDFIRFDAVYTDRAPATGFILINKSNDSIVFTNKDNVNIEALTVFKIRYNLIIDDL